MHSEPTILIGHNGQPAERNQYAFPAPDPSIGTELSRHGFNRRHSPTGRMSGGDAFRLIITGFAFFVLGTGIGAGIGTAITMQLGMSTPFILFGTSLLTGVLMALIVLRLRKKAWVATYVGTEGIARYAQFEQGGRIEMEILRFAKASDIKAVEGLVALHGAQGTAFDYSWRTPTGSEVYSIRGVYRGTTPEQDSEVHFARAAKEAFDKFRMRDAFRAGTLPMGAPAVPPPPPPHRQAA